MSWTLVFALGIGCKKDDKSSDKGDVADEVTS